MADLDHEPEGPAGPRRGRARPVLALAALLPLIAASGLLATGTEPPEETAPVTRAEATSEPGAVAMHCPGPLQLPEDTLEAGPDEELAVTAPATDVDVGALALEPASSLLFGNVSASETLQQDDGEVRAPEITAEDSAGSALDAGTATADLGAGVLVPTTVEERTRIVAAASDGGRPVADAVQTTSTPSGDYRSLSATRCPRPATEASFLGASTADGSSSTLVLRNPTSRPATAAVQVWTPEGPAAMAGRSQVVIPPGEEETVLLDSVASGHDELGVEVDVTGSPLAMHVQTTRRDGLTPGGAEILAPLPAAGTDLAMPGVEVAGTAPTVLLANPQGAEATASVRVAGPDGEITAAAQEETPVPAGTVVPVPLEGLPEGHHTVRVAADAELTATTRSAVAGADLPGDTIGAPVDMTLVAPAPAIGTSAMTALPAGGAYGKLNLAATADTAVTVIPIAADGSAGDPVAYDLAAGTTTTVTDHALRIGDETAAGITVVPEEPGTVHASWLQRVSDGADGVLLSALPVLPTTLGDDAVTVRLTG